MLTSFSAELFASLARSHPGLRAHLQADLEKQHSQLVTQNDERTIYRTQGHARCLKSLIDNLDASTKPPNRTTT